MKKYALEDIKRGNHVIFKRTGVNDFDLHWTVVGFHNKMIEVKIEEMGHSDQIFIDVDDIQSLLEVNDTRYKFK